ncbi:hypothetical protein HCG51_14590 [Tolypothrix sp. PCC 7910]|uniref:hypothetical protein n=1 Tax=Tolypothrix sp. PCC 7910 TaxID=2099387 RepID=UPI0014279782|nr:hypothetical protein [Tolypothrix sp. PCC 7910]QIR37817.1 hypothetical protein HCG51_14590 [Tolypothrix sp. PCC 7910]
MVQQIRSNQPQYICIIPVASITGNQEEEMIAFGVSVDEAKRQAEEFLASTYGCNLLQIAELIQQSRIEQIAQWCTPSSSPISENL